jgi:acetylornithine deacetylase/succinyl-diaminopimelate desuccinylase-like protein
LALLRLFLFFCELHYSNSFFREKLGGAWHFYLKAASWIANKLENIGMQHVEIVQTKGHPIIYADWLHQENAPTVLVYGHYDVQPDDTIHLWETPPFEPNIRTGLWKSTCL